MIAQVIVDDRQQHPVAEALSRSASRIAQLPVGWAVLVASLLLVAGLAFGIALLLLVLLIKICTCAARLLGVLSPRTPDPELDDPDDF